MGAHEVWRDTESVATCVVDLFAYRQRQGALLHKKRLATRDSRGNPLDKTAEEDWRFESTSCVPMALWPVCDHPQLTDPGVENPHGFSTLPAHCGAHRGGH